MVCDFRYCDCVTAHCCGNGSTAEDTSLHVQKEYEAEDSKKADSYGISAFVPGIPPLQACLPRTVDGAVQQGNQQGDGTSF